MDRNGNIEMKRIFDILKSKVLLIMIIVLAFVMLGYMYSYYYVVPKYSSTETLLLIPNNEADGSMITSSDLTLNSGLIATYSDIAKQSRVLKQVIENLNLNMTEKELLSKTKVSFTNDTYIIEITVTDTNPELARQITEEISNVFLKEIKEIYNLENIGIVDRAEAASSPYNVKHTKDLVMFAAAGMVFAGIIIVCIYIFDNTVKTEEDIEMYAEMKTLGKIPMNTNKKQEIMLKDNAKSYVTECINTIRTNILYMNSVKSAKTILVTSCKAQEGKSWVSANIASAFAETNKKVLLIDADMRKGRAHKIFKLSNNVGLSNYLYFMTGNVKKDLELSKNYIKETDIPNLHILTNGNIPPNPSELLDSQNMKDLIKIMKQVYDVIIVDAPPCMLVTDSIVLSTIIDSSILVVNSEKTKINDLVGVKKQLEIVGGNVIGAILNKVKLQGKVYSKSYYYGHAKKEDKSEVKERRIITVNEVIEEAKTRLEERNYNISSEEHKTITTTMEKAMVQNDMSKIEETQGLYFDKMINAVADLKRQVNRSLADSSNESEEGKAYIEEMISKKLSEFKEDSDLRIKEEIKGLDYKEELEGVYNEIKGIRENNDTLLQNVKDTSYMDTLINEINKNKLTKEDIEEVIRGGALTAEEVETIVSKNRLSKEEIENMINSQSLTAEDVESIVSKNNLNKEDIEKIVKSGALTAEEVEAIVNKNSLSREEIENIVKSQVLTVQDVENAVNRNRLTKEEIESIIRSERLEKEDIQDIIKSEMLSINYTNQLKQIEEMIMNLKDNYLELSNKLSMQEEREKEREKARARERLLEAAKVVEKEKAKVKEMEAEATEEAERNEKPDNIIDIKELKKAKKRKSYSINEDILFSDLEETAYCVIPFNSQEDYNRREAK